MVCAPLENYSFQRAHQIRARQKGDSKSEKPDPERTFSQIFADSRWFSARSVKQGIWESQICAGNRRKPQIFAGNRRKPQIFAETGFSHLLSLFWCAPIKSPFHDSCCSFLFGQHLVYSGGENSPQRLSKIWVWAVVGQPHYLTKACFSII